MNELKFIETKNKKYPMLFSLNVMEQLQNKYGSFTKWSELLEPKEEGAEPNLGAIIDTFHFAINEGIAYGNYINNENEKQISRSVAGFILTEVGTKKATEKLKNLVVDSTKSDEEPKNE